MSERDRSEVLATLAELARHYPHWRLGQLVANVAGWTNVDVWDVEDEQLLVAARDHLRVAVDRDANGPGPNQPQETAAQSGRGC
jgi:hypothetical protein